MKKYQGTKEVHAEPMMLGDFIETRKRNPYANDSAQHDLSENGYLVVYEDGYESWSPKEAFDKAYRPVETFVERLYVEKKQLEQRVDKLQDFIHSDKFKDLELWERESMYEQLALMRAYCNIVNQRYYRHAQPTPCCCSCVA